MCGDPQEMTKNMDHHRIGRRSVEVRTCSWGLYVSGPCKNRVLRLRPSAQGVALYQGGLGVIETLKRHRARFPLSADSDSILHDPWPLTGA